MEDVSYFEAWQLWFDGESLVGRSLWGISIFWWGRIGRFTTLLATLAVLVEIVGPERLNAFGRSLDKQFSKERTWEILARGVHSLYLIWSLMRAKGEEEERLSKEFRETVVGRVTVAVSLILAAIVSIQFFDMLGEWALFLGLLTASASILILPAIVSVIALLLNVLYFAINRALIGPIVNVLQMPSLAALVKLGSLAILLVGFHFELLAS